MPIAKIRLPDGRIGRFRVPEGTTQEQVMAFVQQENIGQPEQGFVPFGAVPENLPPGSVPPIIPEGAVAGFVSGAVKTVGGISQALAKAGELKLFPGLPAPLPAGTEQKVSEFFQPTVQKLQRRFGDKPGFTTAETVTQVAPLLALPAIGGRAIAGRVAGGGVTGAGIGATGFRPEETEAERTAARGKATVVSAAFGAGGAGLVELSKARAIRKAIAPLRAKIIKQARKDGFVIPPAEVEETAATSVLASVGGKASIRQSASLKNQKVTDKLIADDLGLPKNTIVTKAVLKDVREKAGKTYQAIKDSKIEIKTNDKFRQGLQELGGDFSAAAREFPDLVKNPFVDKMVKALNVKSMSPRAAVELTKKLRADAKTNLKAFDNPEKAALGTAQRQAADMIDELISQNLKSAGKGKLFAEWKKARQTIAKTHDAETAFTVDGNFDARIFSRLLAKGAPLSGGAKRVGEFAGTFPFAVQLPSKAGGAGVSRLQLTEAIAAGLGGTILGGGAMGTAAAVVPFIAPPVSRAIQLSRPFQAGLASAPLQLPAATVPIAAGLSRR